MALPESQRGPQHRSAKTWTLKAPDGTVQTVVNLLDWARKNSECYFGKPSTDKNAQIIASGIRNLRRSMEGKLRRPDGTPYRVLQYKGWELISVEDNPARAAKNKLVEKVTATEYAAAKNVSASRISGLLKQNRFASAEKRGRTWYLDPNEPYPVPLERRNITPYIMPTGHCLVCGKAVDGKRRYCEDCKRKKERDYANQHMEEIRSANRKYYLKNRDEIRERNKRKNRESIPDGDHKNQMEALETFMRDRELTQTSVAQAISVSRQAVSAWFRGKYSISLKAWAKLTEAFPELTRYLESVQQKEPEG